jgi:hypothetical protein
VANAVSGFTFTKTSNLLAVGGNVDASNFNGNVFGTSVSASGTVTAASTVGGVITGSSTSVTGSQTAASTVGGVITGSSSSVTGTQTAASTVGGVITGSSTSVTGAVSGASASVSGGVTAASVAGGVITGSSTSVTGTTTAASLVGGVITGTSVSVSGNVTGGNIVTGGAISITGASTAASYSATGNITGGNLSVGTGTIIGGNLSAGTGNITMGNIVNGNGNGVGNIGDSSTYFNTVFAKATSAQYADLAENYEANAVYEPGTVLCFGGSKEVTVCNLENCTRVAGVVSTNPSYLMNAGQTGDHVVAVALQGRVPTKVTGQVRKGDLMVSAGNGTARAEHTPAMGTVIGKALEAFDGEIGTIEIVVGRL